MRASGFQNVIVHTDYRPQRSCGQGNVFTRVCHSVHRGWGCLPQCMLGYHTPLQQTPPGSSHPPLGAETPQSRQPPPGADTLPRAGTPKSRHPPGLSTHTPPPGSRLRHTVNDRPVRILLECILVLICLWTSKLVLTNSLYCP